MTITGMIESWAPGMRAFSTVNHHAILEGETEPVDLGIEDCDAYRVLAVDSLILLVVAEMPGSASGWEPSAQFIPDMSDPATALLMNAS